jgi:hypothetical protein
MTVNIKNGLTAGFVATVVLSIVMMVKQAVGLVPGLNPIDLVANILANLTGGAPSPIAGWVIHFGIGTVLWGVGYAAIQSLLPGSPAVRGMLFATGAWLIMMVIVMPIGGAGMFGLGLGPIAPVATLALHLVFGATLGIVYAKSEGGAARADVMPR